MSKRQLAATAHHEAGHAVVGMGEGLGWRLVRVSIVPDPDEGTLGHVLRGGRWPRVRDIRLGPDGLVQTFYRDLDPGCDEAEKVERLLTPQVMTAFAGVIAERRFTGRRHNWAGAATDTRWAVHCIDAISSSVRVAQKLSDYLWAATQDRVDHGWTDIEAVAAALLAKPTLSGEEVSAAMWPDAPEALRRAR